MAVLLHEARRCIFTPWVGVKITRGGGLMSSRFTLRTLPAFLAVHTFCAHAMVMAKRAWIVALWTEEESSVIFRLRIFSKRRRWHRSTVAWVRFLELTSHVGWVCCSTVSLQDVLVFFPPPKAIYLNSNFDPETIDIESLSVSSVASLQLQLLNARFLFFTTGIPCWLWYGMGWRWRYWLWLWSFRRTNIHTCPQLSQQTRSLESK